MPASVRTLVFAALALFTAACAGPAATREPVVPPRPVTPPPPEEPAAPPYETFDPASAPERAPSTAPAAPVQHDVPSELMAGRIELPEEPLRAVRRQVPGFRIQVFSSQDRAAAEDKREEAREWGVAGDAYVAHHRPHYRVQVGDFEDRGGAEAVLAAARRRYPGAFIVPATVTITVME